MIIYGVMTDTSVPKLYLAGFIPGFILTVLFSLTVLIACIWRPHWGGDAGSRPTGRAHRSLPDLLPPLVLLLIVIGAIFFGIATATESAAVGIVGALAITAWRGRLVVAHAARRLRGHGAHDGDGGGDPGRRLLPQRHHPDDRAHPAAQQADHGRTS